MTEGKLLWMFDNVLVYISGQVSTIDGIFLEPSEYDEQGNPIYVLFMNGQKSRIPLWRLMYGGYIEDSSLRVPDKVGFHDNNTRNCALDNLRFFEVLDGSEQELIVGQYTDKEGVIRYHIDRRYHRRVRCNENGLLYLGPREAARDLGLDAGNISSALKGRRRSVGGYTFAYVDEG